MPKLEKALPIFVGTCTIYTDVTRRQWRAIEASKSRKDIKIRCNDGSRTNEQWQKLVQRCRDNTKCLCKAFPF